MSTFQVERSIDIHAQPDRVFAVVADYHTWTTWSPWLCAEPDAKVTVTADGSSVGSVYAWTGEVTGQGEIEHKRLEPGRLIEDEIRFLKPFKSKSRVAFALNSHGEETRLTWSMDGSLPWFLFWMKPTMTSFIGMDYDRGLKMLKEWIETGAIRSQTIVRGVEPVGPLRMAGVRKTCHVGQVGPSMEEAFREANLEFSRSGLPLDGSMMSVYHRFDVPRQIFEFTSGYAIPDASRLIPSGPSEWSLPASSALLVEHVGSYDHLGNAWSAAIFGMGIPQEDFRTDERPSSLPNPARTPRSSVCWTPRTGTGDDQLPACRKG